MTAKPLDPTRRNPVTLPDGQVLENLVYLNQVIDHPNITIGDFSYLNSFTPVEDWAGRLAPYLYAGAPEKLVIGKYCQFAQGTLMITSSANHPMRGVSTYPFAIFRPGSLSAYVDEISTRGDTVIGNDVWTGHDVKIMPGVKIGDGAIIGAGAVVTGDVPPYAIMAGNPARLVRLRFSEAVVTALVSIAWWNWEHSRAEAALPGLSAAALAGDIATLQALAKQGTDKER